MVQTGLSHSNRYSEVLQVYKFISKLQNFHNPETKQKSRCKKCLELKCGVRVVSPNFLCAPIIVANTWTQKTLIILEVQLQYCNLQT